MIIDIHDVGHGACSVVTYPNGARVMIDAGHRTYPYWSPASHYHGEVIDLLVIQNLDEDHVQALPELLDKVKFRGFLSNGSVDSQKLAYMKSRFGMGNGIRTAHNILQRYGPVWNHDSDLGEGWWHGFWNTYGLSFNDTNNLSVPIFLGWRNFTILFGGDLEEIGWKNLLRMPAFVDRLSRVNVLVASHHGRENGCCDDLFKYCTPDLVVISDYEHRYNSQQTVQWYRQRTKGIYNNTCPFSLSGPQKRYVMTTRGDGSIKIAIHPFSNFTVYSTPTPTSQSLLLDYLRRAG